MIPRLQYATGGRATFTVVSKRTEERFTYKITRKKGSNVLFVRARQGARYDYLGVIFCDGNYRHGAKSLVDPESLVARSFKWLWNHLNTDKVEFLPSGTCCCCGRKLTTPESIAKGVGPECEKKLS